MGWPVVTDKIVLYRNDRRILSWPFFHAPPAWQPSTAYVEGVVGTPGNPPPYLADSTVSYGFDAEGLAVYYTCIEAHTSSSSFDPTKWTADAMAVGPPIDLTGFGSSLLGQVRQQQDAGVITVLDTSASDLAGGVVTVTLTVQNWTDLDASDQSPVGWDIQIQNDPEPPLTLLVGKFGIKKDWTHV